MTRHHLRLDDLHGRKVRDVSGRPVGRIYDMRAETRDGQLVVVEYYIGAGALLEGIGLHAMRLIGLETPAPRAVPWDKLDLSDPERPTLLD